MSKYYPLSDVKGFVYLKFVIAFIMKNKQKRFCQKWDSNPCPQMWTATWTQRLRPLGHPDFIFLNLDWSFSIFDIPLSNKVIKRHSIESSRPDMKKWNVLEVVLILIVSYLNVGIIVQESCETFQRNQFFHVEFHVICHAI